jgi:hypothetical protein
MSTPSTSSPNLRRRQGASAGMVVNSNPLSFPDVDQPSPAVGAAGPWASSPLNEAGRSSMAPSCDRTDQAHQRSARALPAQAQPSFRSGVQQASGPQCHCDIQPVDISLSSIDQVPDECGEGFGDTGAFVSARRSRKRTLHERRAFDHSGYQGGPSSDGDSPVTQALAASASRLRAEAGLRHSNHLAHHLSVFSFARATFVWLVTLLLSCHPTHVRVHIVR